jgi:hypothetical protein
MEPRMQDTNDGDAPRTELDGLDIRSNELERAWRQLLFDDIRRGIADILAGRTQEADAALASLQERRAAAGESNGSSAKPD